MGIRALIFATVVGIVLDIVAATKHGRALDYISVINDISARKTDNLLESLRLGIDKSKVSWLWKIINDGLTAEYHGL